MKTKYIGLLVVLVLVLSLALTACGGSDPVALTTPVVTVDANGVASWNAVEGAAKYVYKINGGAETETTKTSVQLAADDKIVVKAVPAEGDTAHLESEYSKEAKFADPTVYGLPAPKTGFYIKDADVMQTSATERYVVYTTNSASGEQDNVIAVVKGELKAKGWAYGEQKVVLQPSESGWDMYLGSASIVKGEFSYGGETYNYLMAYSATAQEDDLSQSIGLAVSKTIDGEYVRVGTAPALAYDKATGGNNPGNYAPSLVNKDKQSAVGLFYTKANKYGHFLYFATLDSANLDNLSLVGSMITNAGELSGSDAITMMPNMDVALGADGFLYAVKDVSPSAALKPQVATSFEYAKIALEEIGTTDAGDGWVPLQAYDYLDLDNGYERAYSASLVSDEYGHAIADVEIVYNVCDTQAENADYVFSQKLLSVVYSAE